MTLTFLLASFVVLSASLMITVGAALTDLRGADRRTYLFSFNKPHYAWLSNVGSILSISLVFVTLIPTVAGWGYVPIYGLVLGIMAGYLSLGLAARRLCRIGMRDQEGKQVTTSLFPRRLTDRTRSKGVDHGVGCPVALVF